MKKFIGVFLAIILIISQSTLVFADKNGANLNLKCKSAVLMDVTSGKVLYEKIVMKITASKCNESNDYAFNM